MTKRPGYRPWPLVALAVVMLMAGCGADHVEEAATPVVEVVNVQPQPFAVTSELPGRIEPVRVAEVRARVAGIVLSRHFEEGADVKAGDLLFRLDPAPFQAALSQAEGELARAEATLAEKQAVVARYTPLVKIEAVSRQDFDAAQAAFKSARAMLKTATAGVDTARLNLEYATVKAPISGRIGRALATEGALVGQDEATPLAMIQQLDPIYADFRQPVADALRLRRAFADGKLQQKESAGAVISISVEGTGEKRDGHLLFSDISVDRGTGQVLLRGRFPNPDGLLLPGMYVRVHTPQGIDPQAILVPQRSVQRNLDGTAQVLLVGANNVVQARIVQTGSMRGTEWQIVEGLKPGDKVIVGGALAAVQPGVAVTIAERSQKQEQVPTQAGVQSD